MRSARKRLVFTQEAVAEKLNITTPVLSKWENDKSVPDLAALCKLCNAYKISISDCIKLEISENPILPPEEYNALVLGETLKELRQRNGWTQAEVGKTLFVTSQTVSKWESGGVSSLEVLGKLAELFGVTPTQLLNGLERNKAMPEKQTTAEQPKKSNRVVLRITAIILGIIIFLGAIAGLITGLVLKGRIRPSDHFHEWGEWQNDSTNHWQSCKCGVDSKKETHNIDGNICIVCGYEKLEPSAPPQTGIDKTLFCLPMQSEIYRTYLENYVQNGFNGFDQHEGLDFSAKVGDSVYAVADGVVKKVISRGPNYFVRIEHGDGLVSVYWGVEATEGIIEGSEVKKGELIGTISENPIDAELYDGPHLHFAMTLNNVNVNPLDYLPYEEDNT